MPHTTLVAADELTARLDDPAWIVFDCRHDLAQPDAGEAAYAAAHVPGARFLHLDRDLAGPVTGTNGRHPLPDPRRFAEKLASAGVNADSQVVAYDDTGGMYAARLWWMLRWIGHPAAAVLDGGWKAWTAKGYAGSSDIPQPRTGNLTAAPRDIAVDTAFLLTHLRQPGMRIVDARAEDRYRGENETLDPVGGRIPGALNRFFRDNLDATGCFKPATQLHADFSRVLQGTAPTTVVHQCGSGVTACHNLLAMEIAGLAGSRLYPGSWSEWCADPARPVVTGPAEHTGPVP